MKTRQVVSTKDESSTLFVPELNQHYHSIHGAIQESQHVFIDAGFSFKKENEQVKIFELGFGTGLNAFMTAEASERERISCEYWSVEKYPLSYEEMELLNYPSLLNKDSNSIDFKLLHSSKWEELARISSYFQIKKLRNDVKSIALPANYFDIIYFDAFAPSSQEDLWSIDIFKKMYSCLKPQGILVTYCVKGDVRRSMKAAGFNVEKIPGPPGKREMARAVALKPEQ